MCGRFNVIDSPGLQQLLRDLGIDLKLPELINAAPTEMVSLIRDVEGECTRTSARWWLTPAWARQVDQKYAMFNSRCETLTESRAFRRPFRSQRGVVPISSFIEWRLEQGVKQPWLIGNEAGAMAVAALWDVWEGGEQPLLSCSLVTTEAAPQFRPWHKRMPVLLAADEWSRWMDNSQPVSAADPLFRSELKSPLRLAPLARAIGNARNKDAALLAAVGEAVTIA